MKMLPLLISELRSRSCGRRGTWCSFPLKQASKRMRPSMLLWTKPWKVGTSGPAPPALMLSDQRGDADFSAWTRETLRSFDAAGRRVATASNLKLRRIRNAGRARQACQAFVRRWRLVSDGSVVHQERICWTTATRACCLQFAPVPRGWRWMESFDVRCRQL